MTRIPGETTRSRSTTADDVAWTAVDVPGWGRLVLAATARGVRLLELRKQGESPQELLVRLGGPAVRDDRRLRPLVERVVTWLGDPGASDLDLPLDVHGTPFQREVWDALRGLRRGTTTTYGALATQIGRPRASQAVGQAVGANPVAFAVPCHRVVAANGEGGYRLGLPLKRRLLALEGSADRP